MHRRGFVLLITAAFLFSLMSVLVKIAGERLSAPMMVLARAVVTVAMSVVWLRLRGISPLGVNKPLLALRGLFGFTGLCCFFFAVTRLPLAEVTTIHFLNPLLTAIFAAIFLGERVGRILIVAIALSVVGGTLVTRPSVLFGASDLDGYGVLAAFGGALASACAYVSVRHLRKTDDPLVIVFWFALVATPLSIPLVIPVWTTPTPTEWLVLLAIGVVTQIAQVALTRGIAEVPAGPATAVGYTQIAFAAGWGLLLFNEPLSPLTVAGTLLVIAGTGLLAARARAG